MRIKLEANSGIDVISKSIFVSKLLMTVSTSSLTLQTNHAGDQTNLQYGKGSGVQYADASSRVLPDEKLDHTPDI